MAEETIQWDDKETIEWDEEPKRESTPNVNRNAAVDALAYSEVLGVEPEAIINDYDNFSAVKKEYQDSSFLQRVKQSWDIGRKNTQLGLLGWRALTGEDVDDKIKGLKSSIPEELPEEYGLVEKAIRAAAKLTPTSLEVLRRGSTQGLALGGAAAGVAAIAGNVGPQMLLPEEAITVPAAFAGMYAVGAGPGMFEASMQIEGGHGYLELLDMEDSNGNKIDPAIAKSAAAGIGVINGALEFAQLKLLLKTIPGADKLITGAINKTVKEAIKNQTIKGIVAKSVAKYGAFITAETAQELAQESTNIFVGEFAKNLNNDLKATDFDPAQREDIIDRLIETAKESALAFLALGLPGSSVRTNMEVAKLVVERNTNAEIQDSANNAVPGHGFEFKGFDVEGGPNGFTLTATAEDSPIQGQTFTTQTLDPIEINRKVNEIKEQIGKADIEASEDTQIKVQEDMRNILKEPDMIQDVVNQRVEELDEATQLYETHKDIWIGKKDQRLLEAEVEKRQIQIDLKTVLGEKRYNQRVKDIDSAIQVHISLKKNPGHIEKYYNDLTEGQQELVDLSQNLPSEVLPIIDRIEKSYEKLGVEALDNKVVKNLLDNYESRVWDVGEKPTAERARKFGTKTRHAKQRKFDTIVQGWAESGMRLKIAGATNNLKIYKEEIIKTIQDKEFLNTLKTLKDSDGNNLISRQQFAGFVEIEHPNFTSWEFSEKVELDLSAVDKTAGLKVGDWVKSPDRGNFGKVVEITDTEVMVKFTNKKEGTESTIGFDKQLGLEGLKKANFGQNYFVAEDGSVFERVNYYAPKQIAKNLNNILGTSSLYKLPAVKTVTKYNAIFKQWILLTSLFHHLAFMRSYWLGTNNKSWSELNVRESYKDGIKSIMNLEPEIMQGVRNGLTMGLRQEWEEALLTERTIIGKVIDQVPGGEAVKNKILDLKQMQTDFLFGTMGAGLKAKSYLIEFRNHTAKNPGVDPDVISKQVASLINDDFGGLHLARLGRNPTTQHLFRLFALAPDWTESNVRTMAKVLVNSEKNPKLKSIEKELYRRFWFGILWKGAAMTGLLNFALAGGDPEKMLKNYKKAWDTGKLNHLALDITPIYKAMGGSGRDRRYFSLWGHFRDPIKFITQSPFKSAHHKGSVVWGLGYEAFAGTDWAGRKFTDLEELMNTGHLTGWGHGGPIDLEQYPSYVLSQLIGTQPIQIQNFAAWMSGEMESFEAISNSLGLGVRRTYEPKLKP